MSLTRTRKPSAKQAEVNRQNGRKSKGPCTPEGKLHVALNALKHGLHAQTAVQAMLALGEKPSGYYYLLGELLASLRPANPHQRMQVEDIAGLRWEKLRLQRARASLIAGKMRQLELERDHRRLEFDYDAPDLPQAEVLQKGLDRVPDCPPKFEKMLSCFTVLISMAKQDEFELDPEPELSLLYGEQPSLEGAYLRNVFRRFRTAQRGVRDSGRVRQPRKRASSIPNPKSKIQNGDEVPSEQERLLLLKTLFAAKQRALRRYQLYNRQFVETTPDQRDACYVPTDDDDVQLMRMAAQNERQLRWALKLYWQTQKEDAACAARQGGEADGVADLVEALEGLAKGEKGEKGKSEKGQEPVSPVPATDESHIFDEEQSHQVDENTEEVSGTGQNNPNLGHLPFEGEQGKSEKGEPLSAFVPVPVSPTPDVGPARAKVTGLLEQMQSDPEARALVETFLLNQMMQEESQQQEAEVAALQRERQKREALEEGLEQMMAAQQELESKNRQLRAQVGESQLIHQQAQEQTKPAEAVVVTRREPTREEIITKISAAIGAGLPMKHYVKSEVEGMPGYHLTEEEYLEYTQGSGRAWEEEQRRKAEAANRARN
jgi:hypothetical protein